MGAISSLISILIILISSNIIEAANIPTLPSGWEYVGCLYEGEAQRIMNTSYLGLTDMTLSLCVQHCNSEGLPFAALERHSQCFCGSTIEYAQPASESNCNYVCMGDASQMCGGWGYMSFFSLSTKNPVIGGNGIIAANSFSVEWATTAGGTGPPATVNTPAAAASSSGGGGGVGNGGNTVKTVTVASPTTQGVTTTATVISPSQVLPISQSPNSQGSIAQSAQSGDTTPSPSLSASTPVNPFLSPSPALSSVPQNSVSNVASSPAASNGQSLLSPPKATTSAAPVMPTAVSVHTQQAPTAGGSSSTPRFKDLSQYVVHGQIALSGGLRVQISAATLLWAALTGIWLGS